MYLLLEHGFAEFFEIDFALIFEIDLIDDLVNNFVIDRLSSIKVHHDLYEISP